MNGSKGKTTLVLLALAMVGACGDDTSSNQTGNGGGGGGEVTLSTGLPSNKTLGSLTEADIKTACDAVSQAGASLSSPANVVRSECFTKGLTGSITASADGKVSVDTAKCQMLMDSCVADPAGAGVVAETEAGSGIDCVNADTAEFAACEATVGELETCFNKIFQAYTEVLASLTCGNGQQLAEGGGPDGLDTSAIPECVSLKAKCPKLEVPGQ